MSGRGDGMRWGVGLAAALMLACGSGEPAGRTSGAEDSMGTSRAAAGENRPPTVHSVRIDPARPVPGERVRGQVHITDPEGDSFRTTYTWRIGGRRIPSDGPEIVLPDVAQRGEPLVLEVTATDGDAESDPAYGEAFVGNRPPEWLALKLSPRQEVPTGASVTVTPRAEDPDGDPVQFRYSWTVNGTAVAEEGPTLSTEGLRRGDAIQVRVAATDGESEAPVLDGEIVMVGNAPPEIVSQPGGISADGVFRYTVEVQDPDGDRNLRFRLAAGPQAMDIDPILGEVTWKPEASDVGRHPVEIQASDEYGGVASQRFDLVLTAEDQTQPPAAPAPEPEPEAESDF
ncbi:MAG: hypothetical protein JSU66_06155 [Deltaproteobacteria bacterium]|nr:MAG: hypothetical protein JSU66_06155 [Deltaproteobacteria bacterium]